jgi:hypothetical protein
MIEITRKKCYATNGKLKQNLLNFINRNLQFRRQYIKRAVNEL